MGVHKGVFARPVKRGKGDDMDIGMSIQLGLMKRRMNRSDLARELGVPPQMVTKWVDQKTMNEARIAQLAEAFGYTPAEFIRLGRICVSSAFEINGEIYMSELESKAPEMKRELTRIRKAFEKLVGKMKECEQ